MHAHLRGPAGALLSVTLATGVVGFVPGAYAADGTLTGVVTGAGSPISGGTVELFTYDADANDWDWAASTQTNDAGRYSFTTAPGPYRLFFYETSGEFVDEAWGDAQDVYYDDAETVTVPDGGIAVADADLAVAARLRGTLTTPQGTPAGNYPVTAIREYSDSTGSGSESQGTATTRSDGTYDIGGLRPGTYVIQFGRYYSMSNMPYALEWWDDASSSASATRLVVEAGERINQLDARLELDAEIDGTVTDAAGQAAPGVFVSALIKVGSEWQTATTVTARQDGTYTLDGLKSGTYLVRFTRTGSAGAWALEYWENAGRTIDATPIVVEATSRVHAINAQLISGEHDTDPSVVNTSLPTISGVPVVGATLTASPGSWSPTPSEIYYYWHRDGEYVEGVDGPTYVPTAADVGKRITVLVKTRAQNYNSGTAESAPTAPISAASPDPAPVPAPTPPAPPVVTPPVITPPDPAVDVPAGLAAVLKGVDTSGKPQVGKTIKVTGLATLFRASTAVSYRFQWYAGTMKIKKATTSKLKVTQAMKGKKLSVKVTATAGATSKSVKLEVGKVK